MNIEDLWLAPESAPAYYYWSEIVRAHYSLALPYCIVKARKDNKWYISDIDCSTDERDFGPHDTLEEAMKVVYIMLRFQRKIK